MGDSVSAGSLKGLAAVFGLIQCGFILEGESQDPRMLQVCRMLLVQSFLVFILGATGAQRNGQRSGRFRVLLVSSHF